MFYRNFLCVSISYFLTIHLVFLSWAILFYFNFLLFGQNINAKKNRKYRKDWFLFTSFFYFNSFFLLYHSIDLSRFTINNRANKNIPFSFTKYISCVCENKLPAWERKSNRKLYLELRLMIPNSIKLNGIKWGKNENFWKGEHQIHTNRIHKIPFNFLFLFFFSYFVGFIIIF